MRTLYLLRHAKSSREERGLEDHDRPLAPRGRRAAPAMAEYMAEHDLDFEVVLCSTATRTRETWDAMADTVGTEASVIHERELYGAAPSDILRILARLPDEVERALVIGHNPGLEELALDLADGRARDRIERMHRKFPTAALAVLESETASWGGLEAGSCRLERFVRPKDLPDDGERRL